MVHVQSAETELKVVLRHVMIATLILWTDALPLARLNLPIYVLELASTLALFAVMARSLQEKIVMTPI